MPSTEPGTWAASVAGLIAAGLSFARLMQWLPMSDDQFNSLMIFIGLALPIVAALFARSKTTPLVEPQDEDGTALVRVGGATPQAQMRAMKGG